MLVGSIVVENQMDFQLSVNRLVDPVEKPQELLMPVPPVTCADGNSGSHIHGRKQRRDSVALVVVRLSGWHPRSQRQNRLGPIERLDLTLLIHA